MTGAARGRAGVRALLLDIDGTVADGILGAPLPGAVEAVRRLRERLPLRFVTNATSRPHREIADWLSACGLLGSPEELVTPARAARRVLGERGHASGVLLADAAAREDFDWFEEGGAGAAVVVASEAHALRIEELQPAFRALLAGAAFYTLQRNRYFRRAGLLVTDLGPVAAFLAYASGREAENLGKPSPLLFAALARELGLRPEEMALAGDDAEFDAAGAEAAGLRGVLVRTGKYRPGDEERVTPRPRAVLDSAADLPAWPGLADT